jgi:uncharacterized protein involved in exopolysaccharide biosynthesis
LQYVRSQQALAAIPNGDRVDLQVLQNATPPVVVVPRKKTLAIVVFLAVVVAVVGLAFVLENLRPRARVIASAASAAPEASATPPRQVGTRHTA